MSGKHSAVGLLRFWLRESDAKSVSQQLALKTAEQWIAHFAACYYLLVGRKGYRELAVHDRGMVLDNFRVLELIAWFGRKNGKGNGMAC